MLLVGNTKVSVCCWRKEGCGMMGGVFYSCGGCQGVGEKDWNGGC